jgi:hypothetical protein
MDFIKIQRLLTIKIRSRQCEHASRATVGGLSFITFWYATRMDSTFSLRTSLAGLSTTCITTSIPMDGCSYGLIVRVRYLDVNFKANSCPSFFYLLLSPIVTGRLGVGSLQLRTKYTDHLIPTATYKDERATWVRYSKAATS